jgi:tetratricopeptide (TPR) repeat protein
MFPCLFPILLSLSLASLDPGSQWFEANKAYSEGRFSQATDLYLQLVDEHPHNPHMWYNLGNSQLRQGQVGYAIAAYRESLARQPRDPDVKANLAFARKEKKDAISPPQVSPIIQTLAFWHFGLSLQELGWLTLVFNLIFWTLMILKLYINDSDTLRWCQFLILLSLLCTATSLLVHIAIPQRIAVVTAAQADVHSGTSRTSVLQFKLHAGSEVEWSEIRDPWVRIALPDKKQGWVHEDEIYRLNL